MKKIHLLFLLLFLLLVSCIEKNYTITVVDRPNMNHQSKNYIGNRAPLQNSSFIKLPSGSIKPGGWLKKYLELQRDGLTGHLGEISAWLEKENNAWLEKGGDHGWEEVPYWLKGYSVIGYTLNDQSMIDETKIWIESVLASQQEDGYFGPINERNGKRELWAHMIMLWCLQSYYEFTEDHRVLDLMTNYFKWQLQVPDENFLKDYWENSRGGDNLLSVLWLYNRTGDEFLLELAEKTHRNTADWTQSTTLPNWHNVNIAQSFREPATYYVLTGDSSMLRASYNVHDLIRRTFGQVPGGMFGADENARLGYIDPRQGTETCGFVEQMASDEIMFRITGDPFWAEHCEDVAFNSYPASVMPDFKALRYITSPNHVMSDSENHHPGIDNRGPFLSMNPFSSRCCQHNHTQGWPYYIENLVLATSDNGVAIALYGECSSTIKVANNVPIKLYESTNYPFDEKVVFTIETNEPVQFPFYFRIPSWAIGAKLHINGKSVTDEIVPGKYACIEREWKNNDEVELLFPMSFSIREWQVNQQSVSVNYGPLTYSLYIKENYIEKDSKETAIWDSKWQKNADPQKWPTTEIYPASSWNYSLVFKKGDLFKDFNVVKREWPTNNFPFTPETVPFKIKAKARKVPSWTLDETGLCGVLPFDNVKRGELEEVELIPMGAARLRVSSFPKTIE
ncbi:MAG: glycoside hydrolase family 127 protein [Bacteroides sp.]|nr:glycoside hydrolase family 127 protein [Bacteroides sp.]